MMGHVSPRSSILAAPKTKSCDRGDAHGPQVLQSSPSDPPEPGLRPHTRRPPRRPGDGGARRMSLLNRLNYGPKQSAHFRHSSTSSPFRFPLNYRQLVFRSIRARDQIHLIRQFQMTSIQHRVHTSGKAEIELDRNEPHMNVNWEE